MSQNLSRRALLKNSLKYFVIAGPVSLTAWQAFSQAAKKAASPSPAAGAGETLKAVPPTDPVASALKYAADANTVDKKIRVAKMGVPGEKQFCHNCTLYTKQGTIDGKEAGKCTMIAGGAVMADGWCTSWMKKA